MTCLIVSGCPQCLRACFHFPRVQRPREEARKAVSHHHISRSCREGHGAVGREGDSVRFSFHSAPVSLNNIPASLWLLENDIIDCGAKF